MSDIPFVLFAPTTSNKQQQPGKARNKPANQRSNSAAKGNNKGTQPNQNASRNQTPNKGTNGACMSILCFIVFWERRGLNWSIDLPML
jgi:hypothetical protein